MRRTRQGTNGLQVFKALFAYLPYPARGVLFHASINYQMFPRPLNPVAIFRFLARFNQFGVGILNFVFYRLMKVETVIERFWSPVFGSSLFVVARKTRMVP